MNTFRYKYNKPVLIMLLAATLVAAAGLCWNVYNLVCFIKDDTFKTVVYALSVAVNAFLLAFVISVTVYGRYVFKNGKLYLYFGFIKTKTDVKDIVQITHFLKSDKLVIYFKDAKFSAIIISPELYGEFTRALLAANPAVISDSSSEDQSE